MKELSIEEKAKAYDEAINRMKHYVVDEYGCSRIKVADVFPELEEGENIRIIKAIKYGLDYVFTNNTTIFEVTKEQCLAWLEKQGEHANFRNNIQIGDKVTRNEDGLLVNLSQLKRVAKPSEQNQSKQKPSDVRTIGYWNVQDIKQKPADKTEPKFKVKYAGNEYNVLEVKEIAGVTYYGIEDEPNHIDYVLPDNCEIASEQKPTDIQSIEKRAYEVFPDDDDENTPFYRQAFIDGAVDYIDCGCKKSSAWSEEDENRFRNLIYLVKHSDEGKATKEGFIKFINRLKSLRPQNKWKPSDEQIEMLENVRKILHTNKDIYGKANNLMYNFEELIRTLEKLKE